MTEKLYQQDVYIKEWDAVITSVQATDQGAWLLTLDRTAFFPEGGGQSCDLGCIGPYPVLDVQEDGDEVVHTVAAGDCTTASAAGAADATVVSANSAADAAGAVIDPPDAAGAANGRTAADAAGAAIDPPGAGQAVHCTLDWARRFDNMQRHCGEHILSGIFYARCGGVNRGFHMGEDYMTIDISLEDDPTDPDTSAPAAIDMKLALECERRANEVIWSDAPVSVFRFEEREAAEKMPLRKALAFDEDISIVCVGSPENAADCVACCGTHPSSAGQVGLIKIYKVENYKNMFRIYFEAGARALSDYDHKHAILTDLSGSYSSSIEDFPDKLHTQEQKLAEVKDQLYHAKKALIDKECEALDAVLASVGAGGHAEGSGDARPAKADPAGAGAARSELPLQDPDAPLLLWILDHLSMDDAFDMAKRYMKKAPKLILLYAKQNTSFILVSGGEPHCGRLVKEYASFYQGKGGGSDVSARAIFSSEENAMLFADLLSKHLR